jgi:glyoxylase-like metal-dependent hydrolase (beta-lactamase superfamily II)
VEARLIRPFVPTRFRAFTPDLLVEDELDLAPYGVVGMVRALPGHTPGSLALRLDDGDVIAGDVMRGGWLGGRIGAGRPRGHYFQADEAAAVAATRTLLAAGARRLHLGHGGPVEAAAAAAHLGGH